MTSNVGTSEAEKSIGFETQRNDLSGYEKMKQRLQDAVKDAFRPEFLNRIDEIIVFHSLKKEHIKQIVTLMIGDVQKQLTNKKLSLEITEAVKDHLVEIGYNPTFGARPLRRAIQQYIENPLSSELLKGTFKDGDTVMAELGANKQITFKRK
jgi:ATP-dependent Clp protease ATP-binding subunit ClpC